MCLLSPMVPHATCYISIMYVSSIEFHIDTEITFCQCHHTQTTPNLIISCWVLAKYSFKINKVLIALLFFGLFIRWWHLCFCHSHGLLKVPDIVVIKFVYLKTIFICICRTKRRKWQNIKKSSGIFSSVM